MVTTLNKVNNGELPDLATLMPRLMAEVDAGSTAVIAEVAEWITALPDAGTEIGMARWQHASGTALQVAMLHLDADSIAAALLLGIDLEASPPLPESVLTQLKMNPAIKVARAVSISA